jgi:Bacteriophage tail sheath protein
MPEYYAPGIHIERESRGERYLDIIKTDCAVFLGMTERGPVGKPVRVSSFKEFKERFGSFIPASYLPYSVYGFFLNGGRECYIIRIAHIYQRAKEEIIQIADGEILSTGGKQLYLVEAKSGGSWGNKIKLQIESSKKKIKTFAITPAGPSSDNIKLSTARRFTKGDIVRIESGPDKDYFEINEVRGTTISFSPDSLKGQYPAGEETEVSVIGYDITIRCGDQTEVFSNLSSGQNSKRYIAEYLEKNSKLVNVEAKKKSTMKFPKSGSVGLSGGIDGTSTIIPDDYIGLSHVAGERVGMALLDELEEGRIILLPDLHTHQDNKNFGGRDGIKAVLRAAIDYVENSKYRFLLIDPPPGLDIKEVQEWREDYDTSYAALAYPWIKAKVYQSEELLPIRVVPPSGYLAGMMAKADIEAGTHHSFANTEIEGIVDTEFPLTQFDSEILNPDGINIILAFPARGIRVWGARTLSSDPALRYINVRRTFNMISESIENGTQWVTFEPNSHALWENVNRLVYFFLKNLWKKGFLQGENTDEAFYVKVDEETNPPEVRDKGELVVEVGIAIVRPAEFIIVTIAQKTLETQEE